MRRNAFRALVLAGALVALSVPVMSITSVSACTGTEGSCTTDGSISGTVSSYYSGITLQTWPSDEVETQLCGQPGTGDCAIPVVIPASLSFGISDNRGQSQGFLVSVGGSGTSFASAPGTPSSRSITLDGDAFTIDSVSATNGGCFGDCAPITALNSAVGQDMEFSVPVACQSPTPADLGNAMYGIGVDYHITLDGQDAENFGLFPGMYVTNVSVSVTEGTGATTGYC